MRKYKLNFGKAQPTVIRGLALAVLVLSGCVSPQPASAPLPQRIILAPDGLKIAGSGGKEISFGRNQPGVEVAINRLVGASASNRSSNGDCELVQWQNGLALTFVKGAFVGWIAGPPVWSAAPQAAGNTCGLG